MDNYDLVPSGLIKLIKQGFNAGVDHSGTSIGQPTNFFVGAALNLCPPEPEQESRNLQRKLRAGADFFVTQPIYRPEEGSGFLSKYEAKHGKLGKPVLVGILPLVSLKHANFLNHEVPGIAIPLRRSSACKGRASSGGRGRTDCGRIDRADQAMGTGRLYHAAVQPLRPDRRYHRQNKTTREYRMIIKWLQRGVIVLIVLASLYASVRNLISTRDLGSTTDDPVADWKSASRL